MRVLLAVSTHDNDYNIDITTLLRAQQNPYSNRSLHLIKKSKVPFSHLKFTNLLAKQRVELFGLYFFSIDMLNGFAQYPQDISKSLNSQWPYLQAKSYSDRQSIFQTFPHLAKINQKLDFSNEREATGLIIRSGNDDNVHKAVKYGIWTTTPKNRSKIEQLWYKKQTNGVNTYLFFSAVKSGMFEGVARLASGYHEETFPFWWQNHTLKFKGYFEIQWVYIKDINNKKFANLYNCEGEQIVKSKDCDALDNKTTLKTLAIFDKKVAKRSIFTDFAYLDERESQYIRKMYEYSNYYSQYKPNNQFDLSQFSLGGHPLSFMGGLGAGGLSSINTSTSISPLISIPPSLLRPSQYENEHRKRYVQKDLLQKRQQEIKQTQS